MIDLSTIPSQYFDYLLKEKRAKANLAYYNENGEWMTKDDLETVTLTENEIYTFANIYYSKRMNKPTLDNDVEVNGSGEIVTMTFDLALANEEVEEYSLSNVEPLSDTNRTPIGFNPSMFSSLMCNGNDLLDSAKTFEVINTKDSVQNSINYITEEMSSLTVKVSSPLTENNYHAVVMNMPEYNEVKIYYFRCTEENMLSNFVKIDDTTYNFTAVQDMNDFIKNGGQISIIFFDTINGLLEDIAQVNDFELFNSNINNIISTTLECKTQPFFPSSEGIYVVKGELKEGVTSIEEGTFATCPILTSIEIPSGVTSIGSFAFINCSNLTSIEIPNGVTLIGENAFNNCSSLTSIEIPSGVTSIGQGTFANCSNLTSIEIPNGVTLIGENAFGSCSNLTIVTFAEGSQLTSIGDSAFYYCSSLTSIEIPSGVTSIDYGAFENCESLTSIEIPSGVTSIGYGAFRYCSNLTSIEIPNGVTLIEENAFGSCSNLTSIEIPSGVTSIGQGTFANCSNLTSIIFADNSQLTSIGESAFANCPNLTSIEIPNGVTSIDTWAFGYCSGLTSIEISSGVTSIGQGAFASCSNLTHITCHAIIAPSVQSNTFIGVGSNGTLYYPEGSDYLSWLSNDDYYLGCYGWNGAIINSEPL